MARRTRDSKAKNGGEPSDKQKQKTLQRASRENGQDGKLTQQMQMKFQIAKSLDMEIFERCVGKEVYLRMTGYTMFGKLTKNGEHFVEIEDVLKVGAHNTTSEILKAYQDYKKGNWASWDIFIKKFGLNKKEINSITTIDDLKRTESE